MPESNENKSKDIYSQLRGDCRDYTWYDQSTAMAGFCFLFSKCGVQSDCEGKFSYFFICTRAKNIMHKYDAKKIKAIHLGSFCVVESTNQKVRSFWASSLTNHDSHSIHAVTKIGNQSCPQAAYRAPSTAQSQNQVFQSRWSDEENADSDCNMMVLRKLIATIMFCQNGDAW